MALISHWTGVGGECVAAGFRLRPQGSSGPGGAPGSSPGRRRPAGLRWNCFPLPADPGHCIILAEDGFHLVPDGMTLLDTDEREPDQFPEIHQPFRPVQEQLFWKGVRPGQELDGFVVDQFGCHLGRDLLGVPGTDQEGHPVVLGADPSVLPCWLPGWQIPKRGTAAGTG